MKHRFVFFDLDGTLTDSEVGIVNCLEYGLQAVGAQIPDRSELRKHIGPSLYDVFAALGVPKQLHDDAIASYRERFTDVGIYENKLIDGVPEMLEALKLQGRTLSLATSKLETFSQRVLEHFKIDQYFSFISGAILDNSRLHKPEVITHAINHFEADPNCIAMIGDRIDDLKGAHICGVDSIAVTWGFGDPTEFNHPGVIGIADHPSEIMELLK